MESDLNRSIKLLEDCLGPYPLSPFEEASESKHFQYSFTMDPHEISKLLKRSNFGTDEMDTVYHKSILSESTVNNPLETLYLEFFEVLHSHSSINEVFETVSDFVRSCGDALKLIENKPEYRNACKWLEIERNTWRLMYILYQDRVMVQTQPESAQNISPVKFSEKLCVQNLFQYEHLIREHQLIIDWLEWTYLVQKSKTPVNVTSGWENTAHQLLAEESIIFHSTKSIVSSLNPDARHFEKVPLHDLDMEDEVKLCRRMFEEIRSGRLEEGQKICEQSQHFWRSAIFEGWKLYHDENAYLFEDEDSATSSADEIEDEDEMQKWISTRDDQSPFPKEGNPNRDLWKHNGFEFCNLTYLDRYEKAAMGAFCGHLKSLVAVSENWEDTLWSYLKVLVDIRVESEIRDVIVKEYMEMPQEYWNQKMTLNEVFDNLHSADTPEVQDEANEPQRIIQKFLILNEIPCLMASIQKWLEDPNITTQFLRFLAHLCLFLEQVVEIHNRLTVEKVLESYVTRLYEMKETALIAFYVAKMNTENQVGFYAAYLEGIEENGERQQALKLGENCGLPILKITKKVVCNILSRSHETEGFGSLVPKITETDKFKISSLEWLLFYDSQRLDALEQSNALISTFITMRKIDAAHLAFDKMPIQIMNEILSQGEPTAEINQIIKEHLSYKLYLNAHETFNVWFKQFSAKPQPPEELPENAQFTEKVAHQHWQSQYKAETERWKLLMADLTKSTKSMLYSVLFFPEGGWLSGSKEADHLRALCIPEIVLLLYRVLSSSEKHGECVQLADVLASEKYGLYKVYSKDKLADVLLKLAESSFSLLNENKDPFGSEKHA